MLSVIDYTVIDNRGKILDKRINFQVGPDDLVPEIAVIMKAKSAGESFSLPIPEGVVHVTILDASDMSSQDEIFLNILGLKNQGNILVSQKYFLGALSIYDKAVEMIDNRLIRRSDRDLSEVIIPVFLNKAYCCLKLSLWPDAIRACNTVIEFDHRNVKALFRRAIARKENRQLGEARRDFLGVLHLEPGNLDAKTELAGFYTSSTAPEQFALESASPIALIEVEIDGKMAGILRFRLHENRVPKTVKNFILNAPKYSYCHVFKAVKDQFFQSGDYAYNDGSGGDCAIDPDRGVHGRMFFNDENLTLEHAQKGLLGMANYGPNTNGSQFYVTLGDVVHSLDQKNVVFGHLTGGQDVLDRINEVANSPYSDWRPLETIVLRTVKLVSG